MFDFMIEFMMGLIGPAIDISIYTTIPPYTTSTTYPTSPFGHWFSYNGYRLSETRLESGAYSVEVRREGGGYGPVCEDKFNDRTAVKMCEMYGYERGYRTTYHTNEEFTATNLVCYDWLFMLDTGYVSTHWGSCESVMYDDADTLPCAKNQALAVFCYRRDDPITYEIYNLEVKSTSKKFTATFSMRFLKLGRRYEVVGGQGLKDHPNSTDVRAVACGEDLDCKLSAKKLNFELSVKQNKKCDESVQLFHMGKVIWT